VTGGNQDGFTLIEVLVAFVIVTLGLSSLYGALGDHYKQAARSDFRQNTLAHALSHMEQIGTSIDAVPASTTGRYDNGAGWRLTIAPIAGDARPPQRFADPMLVLLEAFDRNGRRVVHLKSTRLLPVEKP
jgi:general secretion pathway protein I